MLTLLGTFHLAMLSDVAGVFAVAAGLIAKCGGGGEGAGGGWIDALAEVAAAAICVVSFEDAREVGGGRHAINLDG